MIGEAKAGAEEATRGAAAPATIDAFRLAGLRWAADLLDAWAEVRPQPQLWPSHRCARRCRRRGGRQPMALGSFLPAYPSVMPTPSRPLLKDCGFPLPRAKQASRLRWIG